MNHGLATFDMSFFGFVLGAAYQHCCQVRPHHQESFTGTRRAPPRGPFQGGGDKPLYLSSPFADAALVEANLKTIPTPPNH